jgi:GTP cyclohydrolase I
MDREKIRRGIELVLEGIGDDPTRPGISETPARVAQLYEELFSGLAEDPSDIIKPIVGEEHHEMVLVRDLPFASASATWPGFSTPWPTGHRFRNG